MSTSPLRHAWLVACIAAFLAYFILLVYCDVSRPEDEGFSLVASAAGLRVDRVAAGGPGARAGLRAGDEIVRVDGQAVRSRMDWSVVAGNFRFDRPVGLEVLRGGTVRALALRQGRATWHHWLTRQGLGVVASRGVQAVCLALAALIALRRPRDPAALLGAWVLASFGVFCVVLPYRIADLWRGLPAGLREALWLPYLSTLVLAGIVLSFFLSYPRPRLRAGWLWVPVWLPIVASAAPHARYQLTAFYAPGSPRPADGFAVLMAASFVYLAATAVTVVRGYRATQDANDRRKLRVLVAGTVIAAFAGVGAVGGYWLGTGELALFESPLVALAALVMLSVPASFSYAILKHRLFDLRLIVRQGVRYAMARGLLVSLVPLLLAVLALDVYLHRDAPVADLVVARAALYTVLVVGLLVALWRRQQWLEALDRRFFRERYDAQRILGKVAADLERAETVEQAAARVAASIHLALHPAFVAVLAGQEDEAAYERVACVPAGEGPGSLRADSRLVGLATVLGGPLQVGDAADQGEAGPLEPEDRAAVKACGLDLVVPVSAGTARPAALLALGARRSGEPYASDDLALLVAIARALGLLLDRRARARPADTFAECPECGTCYAPGVTACGREGARLADSRLPRVLAGRYRVEARLGQGGMGVVYRAHDEALDRPVAVKLLREELNADRRAVERFHREARLSARFSHPHVVTIHDFGVLDVGHAFLVMELLAGRTLREELSAAGRLGPGRVLHVLRPVCGALAAAHRRQLVHRDLKPENIFLADVEGVETPKVLDFGIAKISGLAAAGRGETGVGVLVGTPQYMAPEQLRGEEAAPGWDLWSLAVVAYELLTGAYPVPGGGLTQQAAGDGAVGRLAAVRDRVGDAHAFFERALAIDPARRPATAEQFLGELEAALSGRAE